MAIVSSVDVIMKVVLRPETITDGIALELPEMQQVQPFQQQWACQILPPLKDRDQRDLQGSLLLSDEGDSWQQQVPVAFSSQTNKRDFFSSMLYLSEFSLRLEPGIMRPFLTFAWQDSTRNVKDLCGRICLYPVHIPLLVLGLIYIHAWNRPAFFTKSDVAQK